MKLQIASRVFAGVFWFVQESSLWPHHLSEKRSSRLPSLGIVLEFALKSMAIAISIILGFFALYYFAASPPLHLFFDVAPPAGPASVYLPVSVIVTPRGSDSMGEVSNSMTPWTLPYPELACPRGVSSVTICLIILN
jgi:hypothetical protein